LIAGFRFDAGEHTYTDLATGELVPHITDMLARTGWVNDAWFTEEACERGTQVHRLTAAYDLEALNVDTCRSTFRPFLLAHVELVRLMRLQMLRVEEAIVSRRWRFGGRPDRHVSVDQLLAVWEIKSGPPDRSHQIQTALQAILSEDELGIPARHVGRFAEYVKATGKGKVEEHTDPRDFDEAYRIIKRCAA